MSQCKYVQCNEGRNAMNQTPHPALPFSGAALRPSEFVRAGTLLTSRDINVNYLTFAPKGAICHARKDQFF